MKVLEERLVRLRKQRGLTQEELAAAVGVARNTIFNYENSRREPTADILRRLATVLRTTSDYLLGISNVPECNCRVPYGYLVISHDDIEKIMINLDDVNTAIEKHRKMLAEFYTKNNEVQETEDDDGDIR